MNKPRFGVFGLLVLGLAAGCDSASAAGKTEGRLMETSDGASDGDSSMGSSSQPPTGTMEHVFVADLRPLNASVNGRPVEGKAFVVVRGNDVTVNITATGLEPGIPHAQHIHGHLTDMVSTCPDQSDDTNHDGVVDVLEGLPKYGPILVSLDNNLTNGPTMDEAGFPKPENACGAIVYNATALFGDIQAGVNAAFPEQMPPLDLGRRAVALHGVRGSITLPPTTQTLDSLDPHATLPVACGELREISCSSCAR